MERINIIGASGSGKSTFSRKLSEKLSSPHIEIDAIFWRPNWTSLSDNELFSDLKDAIAGESWILDGNYTRTIPIKWSRATMVIWIDLPLYQNLYQAVVRAFRRAWSGEELWSGTDNRESFRKSFFSRDSIILWTIQTHAKFREQYESMSQDPQYSHIRFVRVRSHKESEELINSLFC